MYINIGNDIILKKEDIISIYNLSSIKNTEGYKKIIKKLENKQKLLYKNDTENKSLILTKEKNIIKGYMSNISSITLAKRAKTNMFK